MGDDTTKQPTAARTREEQILGLGDRIQRGCPDLPLAQILAKNYVDEAERRGYDRRVAEEKGDPVYQYRATISYWIDTTLAFFEQRKQQGQECRVLYRTPQPDTRDETIREQAAEIERIDRRDGNEGRGHD